jgi:hypothetical protein
VLFVYSVDEPVQAEKSHQVQTEQSTDSGFFLNVLIKVKDLNVENPVELNKVNVNRDCACICLVIQ